MKNVPPSVRAALKKRGQDALLEQEGDYSQYKAQIDQILHGNEPLESGSDDYETDIEVKISPEETKANKVIEGYGDKYANSGMSDEEKELYKSHQFDESVDAPLSERDELHKQMQDKLGDDYDPMEADASIAGELMDRDSARPNHGKVVDMLNDDIIDEDSLYLMARKYIGEDELNKLAESTDKYPDDVPYQEILASMSDNDISDMLRVNGLDDVYEDDLDNEDFESTIDNIMKRSKEITDAFEMPAEDGWKETSFGEKSFIKNEGKDNEAFIQYNGSDYDGSNQEYVAGYMENGEYITQEFSNLEEAKDFINNMPESKQDELDDNVANKPQENKKPLDSYKQLRNTIKKYKNNEQDIKRTIKELSDIFGNNESIIEYLLGVVDKY